MGARHGSLHRRGTRVRVASGNERALFSCSGSRARPAYVVAQAVKGPFLFACQCGASAVGITEPVRDRIFAELRRVPLGLRA